MAEDGLRYDEFVQDALRGVVKAALREVAENGFPGDHHFYITFKTNHPGVDIAEHLLARYADEMTVVLQHQFYGLEIHDDRFEVTLSFNKSLERLEIPFAALTAFVDPSVNFGLQFNAEGEVTAVDPSQPGLPAVAATDSNDDTSRDDETESDSEAPEEDPPEGGATVVSLDSFRKKS